jgi:flagellar motor switch protein FliG
MVDGFPMSGLAKNLNGAQKCAVLCLALGPDDAAKIMRQLSPPEVEKVTREILAMTDVEPDLVTAVLQDFQEAARKASQATSHGGEEFARRLLEQAVGQSHAGEIIEKVREDEENSPFSVLKHATPELIARVLRGERPQTIALVLSHLDQKQASKVVQAFEPEVAGDVLYRMARMEKILPDALAVVESLVRNKIEASTTAVVEPTGGPAVVAKVLNITGPQQEDLLGAIERRDPDVASKVRAMMFVFEDLLQIDAKGIQRILREIDTKELALCLKAASDDLKNHIKSQMSERAASALDEEIELLGPVRVRDVEAAHARTIESVRRLEQAGEIMIRSQDAENDIIA